MILASFNVENLFERAKALNLDTWADGKTILTNFAKLNALLQNATYTAANKKNILTLLKDLGLSKSDESAFVILRQNHGKLLKRPKSGPAEVVANGRGDWIGWLELKTGPMNEEASRMTARVWRDVNADVLAVIEAEDRPALVHFNRDVMAMVDGDPYHHVLLIDGNDDRGIDVGILTRKDYDITSICTHVDDAVPPPGKGTIFSRDCPEYKIQTPQGNTFLLLINHFKSKGYTTSPGGADARRKAQAERVRQIYEKRRADGQSMIAVVGDLNDFPDSDPLQPLLAQTDLMDISQHTSFDDGGFPGTFGNCNQKDKIDYILMSPALFAKVAEGGVFRRGAWGGTNGDRWPVYPELTKKIEAASDHCAIWAKLNI